MEALDDLINNLQGVAAESQSTHPDVSSLQRKKTINKSNSHTRLIPVEQKTSTQDLDAPNAWHKVNETVKRLSHKNNPQLQMMTADSNPLVFGSLNNGTPDSPYTPHPITPHTPMQEKVINLVPHPHQLHSIQQSSINTANQPVQPANRLPMCIACHQEIQGASLLASGHHFHPDCFRCQGLISIKKGEKSTMCSRPLAQAIYYEKDSQILCEKCFIDANCPTCKFCSEPIKGRCINALDATFHPEHFFCGQCGKVFDIANGAGYMEYQGKAYCEEDYAALFANSCAKCNKPLLENYLVAAGKMWHPGCFACEDCNKPFEAHDSFFELDGANLCEQHYHQRKSHVCHTCNKPILGRCINALGKRYHEEHFLCSFCKVQLNVFGTGSQGFKGQHGKPYCNQCHLKLYE